MVNQLLDFDSLHNLSLVNRRIRVTCSPFLFRCVSIDFSSPSFEALIALTQSPVANHVKALKYYASDLLQPSMRIVPN